MRKCSTIGIRSGKYSINYLPIRQAAFIILFLHNGVANVKYISYFVNL